MTNTPQINAQTPGPLTVGSTLERTGATWITHQAAGNVAMAAALWRKDIPEGKRGYPEDYARAEITANARLLAAAYTMADKAGRELVVDAAKLCETLDLAALIGAAQRALDLAKRGLGSTKPGSAAFVEFATLEESMRSALSKLT